MKIRTDLALESREFFCSENKVSEISGVVSEKQNIKGFDVTTVKITDKNGEKAIGKPIGSYVTKKEIRRSINSQVLTVFFSPLAFAGIHLVFAFPFVWRILMLFNLSNQPFVIAVTALCFVIFGLFYALVYKITSNSYYSIVSGH